MKMVKDIKLKEGYYSSDHKLLNIVDCETGETIAHDVPVDYAKLMIKAVNDHEQSK